MSSCIFFLLPTANKRTQKWFLASNLLITEMWRKVSIIKTNMLTAWHFALQLFNSWATIWTRISCRWQTRATRCITANRKRSDSAHAKHSASHHMVIKPFLILGQAAEYTSRRWMWSTLPPTVRTYDTLRRTKLTAPETISRSRDNFVPAKI